MSSGKNAVSETMSRDLAREGRLVRQSIASTRSETLLRLFDFLLQQSIAGQSPRETDIANSVFSAGQHEPADHGSRVRVSVYRLRKKLDQFYHDKQGPRLIIQQGEYGIRFVTPPASNDETAQPAGKFLQANRFLVPTLVTVLILLNFLMAFLYFRSPSGEAHDRPGVAQILGNNDPTVTLVIGDYYQFVKRQDDGSQNVVQDLAIDSADTFYEKIAKGSVDQQEMLMNEDLYAVSSDILGSTDQVANALIGYTVKPITSSDLDAGIMKLSSIIYVGALDAISPLLSDPLRQASKLRCGATCYEMIDTSSGRRFLSDSPYTLREKIVPRRDYGYIASFPGPSGKQVLILSGTGDAGAAQMVNVVMDKRMIAQLQQRLNGKLRSFEALYQVRTMFNRSYSSTLLFARPIDAATIWDRAEPDQ